MKKNLLLSLVASIIVTSSAHAQLPAVPGLDFSKADGTITDTRDNKTYAYKTYGDTDWFMQNLNWDGEGALCGPDDADGAKYGRYYSKTVANKNICPPGWIPAPKEEWVKMIKYVADDLELPMVDRSHLANATPPTQRDMWPRNGNNYTIYNVGKYLRGGTAGADGVWTRGNISALAAQTQFNMLPAGSHNGTDGYTEGAEPGKTCWFIISTNELYGFLTNANSEVETHDDYCDNFRHDSSSARSWGNVRCVRPSAVGGGEVNTPYPTTIDLKQSRSADAEKKRLAQSQSKCDLQPTGFYVYPGKKVVVNVEYTTQPTDTEKPKLIVGTMGQNPSTDIKTFDLNPGINEFTTEAGGLIHLRYVSYSREGGTNGVARITFTDASEHVRAPRYVHGVTTNEDFTNMLIAYPTPEALYVSDYAIACATYTDAYSYRADDRVQWMEAIHFLLEREDYISGLDDNDPNPLHHRLPKGEVRHLFIRTTNTSPHATNGYTAYPVASTNRYLTYDGVHGDANGSSRCWMMGHEVGHQHQQDAYKISQATESTVNIYPYVVERTIRAKFGQDYNRTTAEKWERIHRSYLSLPVEERVYNMDDSRMEEVSDGIEKNEVRFMPWEQLFLLFGDEFYRTLHRVTREEGIQSGTEQERRYYLIWKSSQISGYDMTEFWNQWGVRITEQAMIDKLTANMLAAKAEGRIAQLPKTIAEVLAVTGQNRPDWTPLPLTGITQGETEEPTPGQRTNLALNKNVSASGSQSGNHYNNINDGSEQTRWAAPDHTYPQWLIIDLGKEYLLNEIAIKWYNAEAGGSPRAYQYKVLLSTNNADYEEVIDRSENADMGLVTDDLKNKQARYLKIDMSGCTYAINAGIWELYVYGNDTETSLNTPSENKEICTVWQNQNSVTVSLTHDAVANVTIYNVTGGQVLSQQIRNSLTTLLPQGIYLVQVSTATHSKVVKVAL